MKEMSKEEDRREAERRSPPAERRDEPARAVMADRRVVENRGVAHAMVDALEDILRWEKASERTIRAAAKVTSPVPN